MQLVTLSWSQCSFTIPQILGPLKIMLNPALCFRNGTTKPGWSYLQHGFNSVQSLSRVWLLATPWTSSPAFSVHHQPPDLVQTHVHRVHLNHPTISSSAVPFFSCIQSFQASGSFPMSQFFASGGQSIGVSASASVLPMNIQDWFPLGVTGWISLQSKGPSIVFSNTIVQKHKFFSTQLLL